MLRLVEIPERVALDLAVVVRGIAARSGSPWAWPTVRFVLRRRRDSLVELRAVAHHQRDDALAPLDVLDARDRDVAHAVERGERGFELFGPEFLAAGIDDEAESTFTTPVDHRPHRRRPSGNQSSRPSGEHVGRGPLRYERKSVGCERRSRRRRCDVHAGRARRRRRRPNRSRSYPRLITFSGSAVGGRAHPAAPCETAHVVTASWVRTPRRASLRVPRASRSSRRPVQ